MTKKKDPPIPEQSQDPLRLLLLKISPLPPEEIARQKLGVQRLKERLGKVTFYAKQAERDPDYWEKFYASRILT